MRRTHNLAALGLAAVMAVAGTFPAVAGSPEFVYTEEKWASLRDNILEYDEIPDLVHEYNPTVLNNQSTYEQNRQGDQSRSSGDIAASYRQSAENLYDQIAALDPDSLTYDSMVVSLEQQAKALEAQAASAETGNFGQQQQNKQAEATIVAAAKTNMITYHQNLLNLELYQKNLELLKEQYGATQRRAEVGMATQMDVLSAKSSIETMEMNILNTEKDIRTAKQNLCLATGWDYNANPEIRSLPQVDLNEIAAIDLEADKESAVTNNYTLSVNRAQYSSTTVPKTKETLEETIANNESQIRSSVTSNYQALIQARSDYEQAQAELELQQKKTDTAALELSIGQLSRLEYKAEEYALENCRTAVQLKEMALLQSLETYKDSVNGLAAVS